MFLGASLTDRAILNASNDQTALANAQARLAAYGFTGTVISRAVSGTVAANLLVQLDAELASRPTVKDWRDTLFIIDFGGNNVTQQRPYDAGEYAALRETLETLRIRLTELRAPFFVLPLTRRNYVSAPTITQDQADTDGSLPYNTAVVEPWLNQHAGKLFLGGRYVFDMYRLTKLHPGLLSADGVHWVPDQQRMFVFAVMSYLADWLQGYLTEGVRGKSFGVDFTTVSEANAEPGYITTSGGHVFNRMNRGALRVRDLSGRVLGGVRVSQNAFSTTGTSGTAAAVARIADTRFHDTGTLLTLFSNIAGGLTYQVDVSGLGAGSTGRVRLVASRDIADATRRTVFTLNGVSATLDAATNAGSNMIELPFTASAEGHIRITGVLDAGSSNGYLSAMIVDVNP